MQKICTGYWLLLTTLLFSRNPLSWFSDQRSADMMYNYLEPIAHFASFLVLTLLVLANRWPISRFSRIALLAGYGLATELVQSRIPGRQMQLVDLVQDGLGIAIGCALYWAWQRFLTHYSTPVSAEVVAG